MKRDSYPVKVIKILPVPNQRKKSPFYTSNRLGEWGRKVKATLARASGRAQVQVRRWWRRYQTGSAPVSTPSGAQGVSTAPAPLPAPTGMGPETDVQALEPVRTSQEQVPRSGKRTVTDLLAGVRTRLRVLDAAAYRRWPTHRKSLTVVRRRLSEGAHLLYQKGHRRFCELRHATDVHRRRIQDRTEGLASRVVLLSRRWTRGGASLRQELQATHGRLDRQRIELIELSSELKAVKADLVHHQQRLDELTTKLIAVQNKLAQPMPSTAHGSTGTPTPHKQAVAKRN